MSRTARDFWLVENAGPAFETTTSAAHAAANAMASGSAKDRAKARIAIVKEVGDRFVTQTNVLQAFMIGYHDGMTEAQLRAWATGLKAALG